NAAAKLSPAPAPGPVAGCALLGYACDQLAVGAIDEKTGAVLLIERDRRMGYPAAEQRDSRGPGLIDAESDPRLSSIRQAQGGFSGVGGLDRGALATLLIDQRDVGSAAVIDRHTHPRRAFVVEQAHARDSTRQADLGARLAARVVQPERWSAIVSDAQSGAQLAGVVEQTQFCDAFAGDIEQRARSAVFVDQSEL